MLAISPLIFLVLIVWEGTEESRFRFPSADGKCHPFDERVSGGFGPGEGASCVVLKPLRDAIFGPQPLILLLQRITYHIFRVNP